MFHGSRSFILAPLLALFLAHLPTFAMAEREMRVERVTFKDGRATIKGRVKGYETVDYAFPAGAGESIRITLKTNKLSNYFNLLPPGSEDEALPDAISVTEYSGVAPTSGDYRARVYLYRNDARRGVAAKYTLAIALGEQSGTKEKGPDYADGLTGGPDFWEVTGVPAGDTLKVRAEPSARTKVVTQVLNKAVMKNKGCKFTRGQRWCRVEDGAGRTGWVNGKFLREAAWPPR